LRLEHLFRRLGELVPRSHPIDHHYALATIFEVMDVAARADLKSDVMKDLDKQKQPSIATAAIRHRRKRAGRVVGQAGSLLHDA
jgi:cell division FtsZ-interacting protein ZapD